MQVKRINVNANEVTKFVFDVWASSFFVKNFTDGAILVCLGDTFVENESIKIPANFAEEIENNFNEQVARYTTKQYTTVTVKAEKGGEVEVQCIN